MMKLYDLCLKMFDWFWSLSNPLRIMMTVGMAATVIIESANYLWGQLFTYIDRMGATTLEQIDFTPLSFINYVFPLDTLLNLLGILAALRITMASIRIIKSFIPTIA